MTTEKCVSLVSDEVYHQTGRPWQVMDLSADVYCWCRSYSDDIRITEKKQYVVISFYYFESYPGPVVQVRY